MTSRPTVTIHGADGAPGKDTHPLPSVFKAPIRPDIVQYVEVDIVLEVAAANSATELFTPAWQRTSGNRTL